MAEHSSGNHAQDMEEHRKTYEGFVTGSVALAIHCGFVLVALCSFAFAHTLNVFTGFAGLIIGTIAILIDVAHGRQMVPVSWRARPVRADYRRQRLLGRRENEARGSF